VAAPAAPIDLEEGASMKRIGLSAIALGIAASVGAGQASAGDKACTLATLDGQYLFAGSRMLFPPAFGVSTPATSASAGFHIFNGDGTGSDFVTFTVNGIDQHVPSPVAITYTINPDCTGTYQVPSAGLHFDIFVAADGSGLSVIDTDPGVAVAEGPQPRVELKKSAP
jgi:hypothetical protein